MAAFGAAAVVAVLRLLPGPGRSAQDALALGEVLAFGTAAALAARGLWRWRPRVPSPAAPVAPPEGGRAPLLERPAVVAAFRLLERTERRLDAFTTSGILLAVLVLVLLLLLRW